jgi:excisionase family DNA binding protein
MSQTMYTSIEAAQAMGVTDQTIRRWIRAGKLPAQHVGLRRAVRIEESDLRKLAEEEKILFQPKQ